MPLVRMDQLMRQARRDGYAVGAFNAHVLDMIPAVLKAAEEERAPIIIEFSPGALKFCGTENAAVLVRRIAGAMTVPVALHLDHGETMEQAEACVQAGFTSVMIDGSKLPYQENLELTARVVKMAHASDVAVEAELGRVGGAEDDLEADLRAAAYTDPAEAADFVTRTGLDCLAVAIGTAHGWYKWEPKLDFERLAAIAEKVDVPLVLHGASGVPDGQIREAVRLGISKINIATELKDPWAKQIQRVVTEKPDEIDPRKIIGPANKAVTEVIRAKMRLFGCSGEA
ncbi:MAG: class II fructose-1,6-bisphosphate aldolase [Bacillota bacterium]